MGGGEITRGGGVRRDDVIGEGRIRAKRLTRQCACWLKGFEETAEAEWRDDAFTGKDGAVCE